MTMSIYFITNILTIAFFINYAFAEDGNVQPRISKVSNDFTDITKDVNTKNNNVKGYFGNLVLDKLSNNALLKPIQENIEKLSSILTTQVLPSNNYGSFQKFDPQNIIDKIHEKSSQLLTGAKASIYGLRPSTNYDYPFAYRRSLTK